MKSNSPESTGLLMDTRSEDHGVTWREDHLRENDGLVPMSEAPYDAEDILRDATRGLSRPPRGRHRMRPSEPRRWLLIAREAGIPDAEGGQARWSLDHLFIDQDAIPTLVEVKRSSDTRLRREVVGQMLDYATNVVAHWPGGSYGIRASSPRGDHDS